MATYPSKVSGEWLKKYITKLHYANVPTSERELFEDADLKGEFKLVDVPLEYVCHGNYFDEELVDQYVGLTNPPPIVLDIQGGIIDGTHRFEAAKARGQKTIGAYVPVTMKVGSMVLVTIPLSKLYRKFGVKTAISLPDLVRQTNAFSKKYRPGCTPTLLDSNPKALFLHYNVKCNKEDSDPGGHDVRVQFDVTKVQESSQAKDLDVQISCSCPAFLYWGAQWNLHQRDGLLGTPRPQLQAPTERLDLRGNFVICKHIHAVFERILPSVQHNIVKIIREREIQRKKDEVDKTPERLHEKQEEMKKKQELEKIRKVKDKEVQDKLYEALRNQEEARLMHEEELEDQVEPVVERDHPATQPAEEAPKPKAPTPAPIPQPKGEEEAIQNLYQGEQKSIEEKHRKGEPHVHRGLPYQETETKEKTVKPSEKSPAYMEKLRKVWQYVKDRAKELALSEEGK